MSLPPAPPAVAKPGDGAIKGKAVNYEALDRQVGAFASRLTAAVGLSAAEATKLATLVAAEVRFLDTDSKAEVIAASPVSLRNRLDELRAFQRWTEIASDVRRNPAVVRAHRPELRMFRLSQRSLFPGAAADKQTRVGDAQMLQVSD